jgi:hypothetical protein
MLGGLAIFVFGALLTWGPSLPGVGLLGRLPGDIRIERPGFRFHFPITSSVVVSVVLTIVLNWLAKK